MFFFDDLGLRSLRHSENNSTKNVSEGSHLSSYSSFRKTDLGRNKSALITTSNPVACYCCRFTLKVVGAKKTWKFGRFLVTKSQKCFFSTVLG